MTARITRQKPVAPLRLLVLLAGVLLLAVGCGPQGGARVAVTAPPAESTAPPAATAPAAAPVRIGPPRPATVALLLPLSGGEADVGMALLQAAELALFETGNDNIRLLPRDTGGTAESARAAARDVLAAGAEIILGPLFSESVAAVAPLARQAGVTMVALSTDRRVAGGGTFLMGFEPAQQTRRIIDFAFASGYRRFAGLIPDSAFGHAVEAVFEEDVVELGGEVAAVEYFPTDTRALFEPVRRLGHYDERRQALLDERRSLEELGPDDSLARERLDALSSLETMGAVDFDSVFIPEGGVMLRALAPLLPFYEIDPLKIRFLGTGLWDDPGLLLEPALIGAWYAGPQPDAKRAFSERYKARLGDTPPRIASLAYDAVLLVSALVDEGRVDRFSARSLGRAEGFAGIDGIFRFPPGGMAERGLAVVEIGKRGFRVLSPAPLTFRPIVN